MRRLFYIPAVLFALLACFADLVWAWCYRQADWWWFLSDNYTDRAEGSQ